MKKSTKILTVILTFVLICSFGLHCFASGVTSIPGSTNETQFEMAPDTLYAIYTDTDTAEQVKCAFSGLMPYYVPYSDTFRIYSTASTQYGNSTPYSSFTCSLNGSYSNYVYTFDLSPYASNGYTLEYQREVRLKPVLITSTQSYFSGTFITRVIASCQIGLLKDGKFEVVSFNDAFNNSLSGEINYNLYERITDSYSLENYDAVYLLDGLVKFERSSNGTFKISTRVVTSPKPLTDLSELLSEISSGNSGSSILEELSSFLYDFAYFFKDLALSAVNMFYDDGFTAIGIISLSLVGISLTVLIFRIIRRFLNFGG